MSTPSTAIILAGGLGTRLRGVIGQTPKCLAPVNSIPFLHYLLQQLLAQGFTHFILALGTGADQVIAFIEQWKAKHAQCQFSFSIEPAPLGTGGAIMQALQFAQTDEVLVVNGDTFLDIDFRSALPLHHETKAECTVLLASMENADRYGTVCRNERGIIDAFREKKSGSSGWINAGAYWINKGSFQQKQWPKTFSWENELLAAECEHGTIAGFPAHGYFIDIGIPSDYEKAQTDFKRIFSHA